LVFLPLRSASSEIAIGALFIGIFRSRLRVGDQDRWLRMLEAEVRVGGMARGMGRATHAQMGLRAPLWWSKCSRSSF
jgi:methyl coenzyme M reductase subunit C-like uncharacterized protein (methanogenesis marker protein 7)